MRVQPKKPRWSAEPGAGGGRVVVPAARSWIAILFLPCWLALWYTGAVSAVREIAAKGPWVGGGFLVFWLCFWMVGGLAAVGALLWMLLGREIVEIGGGALGLRREIAGIGYSREYDLGQVRDLRVSLTTRSGKGRSLSPVVSIAFDYGARTYRFGQGLAEAEAKGVVLYLQQSAPSLAPRSPESAAAGARGEG